MPVFLMEPVSSAKRRHVAAVLRTPETPPGPDMSEVERRLREIRDYSLANLETLIAGLTSGSACGCDVEVTVAQDAEQAVDAILRIAGTSQIAVNRSAVVANELVPALTAAGRAVITSYLQEFAPSEDGPTDYWQLPGITFDARFDSFEKLVDLAAARAASIATAGVKDFTALLGVNAISEDGTILMLQHMQNIRTVFEQAKTVIFVAGIDKIVKSPDDAAFQTRCMAVFGSEVLPLTLGVRSGRNPGEWLPRPSAQPGSARLHLVVLDNGRSRVMRSPYRELLACIDCRACTKGCPSSRFFTEDATWSPKEYLYFSVVGKHQPPDRCLQCRTCEANCPLHIDVPGMIVKAKAESFSRSHPSLVDVALSHSGTLQRLGSPVAPLANLLLGNGLMRRVGERTLGISRGRQMPRLHRRTFARWFATRAGKG